MRTSCLAVVLSLACVQAEPKVPELCLEEDFVDDSVESACKEIERLVKRFERLGKLHTQVKSVRQSEQRGNYAHVIDDISPIDGVLVDAWIGLYLDSNDPETESTRLKELLAVSHSYSNQLVWLMFDRHTGWFEDAFAEAVGVLRHSLRESVSDVERDIGEQEESLSQMENQYLSDKEKFEAHVTKFAKIRSVMKYLGNDAPESPDFRPFGGFQVYKELMWTVVSKLDQETDETSIFTLQAEVMELIRKLKRLGLEPKGIWRICKESYIDIVNRTDLRVGLKKASAAIARQRTDIDALKEHREYLLSRIVSL